MPSDDETIDQRAPAGGALPPLGAHVSVAGGLPTAIPRAEELGCTAIQIFVRNPNSWRSPPISEDDAESFAALREESIVGPVGYDDFWAEVEEVLGLDAVGCLHLNDSLRPFASRKDRHAHVGEGEMGVAPFARLLHDGRLTRVPMVLETETGDGMAGHRRDLELLRSLAPEDGGRL